MWLSEPTQSIYRSAPASPRSPSHPPGGRGRPLPPLFRGSIFLASLSAAGSRGLLQAVADLVPAEAQQARGAAAVAAAAVQGLVQEVVLEPGKVEALGGQLDLVRRGVVSEGRGQVGLGEPVALAQQHRAFDHVLELADVAGPAVSAEAGEGAARDAVHALVEGVVVDLHEEGGEPR